MAIDLPGQTVFPFAERRGGSAEQGSCTPVAEAGSKGGAVILPLPNKPTCTPREAADCLGMSGRQIRYFVEDGTLLAINSSREPASGRNPEARRNFWRVVVRRGADLRGGEFDKFMTLEEFVQRRNNMTV